jgi:putative MATE family efflux protein
LAGLVCSSMFSSAKNVLLMPRDKVFSNKIIHLALPMILQQFLMSSLFIFDTIFIGGLGDAYISGVGQSNNLTMLMWCGYYAVTSTGAIFSAQYWGKNKDKIGIRKSFTGSLVFNSFIAVTFFILALVFNKSVMSVLHSDEGVRSIGAGYLSLVCFAYPVWAVSSVYAATLRSMGITKTPMIASVVAVVINILLDSVFVCGNLGFPKLGVTAAAASTVLGAALELTLLLIFARRSGSALEARKADFVWPGKDMIRKLLKTALPLTAKDMFWALGITVYSISFAALGVASSAAYNVYNTLGEFMNLFFFSFGSAGGVLIGHSLGAGEIDRSKNYAWRLLRLIFLSCLALCPVFILLRDVMLLPFPNLSAEATANVQSALLLISFIIWAKGINFSNMNGILRAGGDTFGAAAIDICVLWLVGVPLTVIAGIALHLPFEVVVSMTCVEELVKVFVSIARVRKYKWARQLV